MKTLHSIWRDTRIIAAQLSVLTPMDLHNDNRYLTRDLPAIRKHGLWYPLLVYTTTLDWWNNKFSKHRSAQCFYIDPMVNSDGYIWAVKMGSNRYQSARDLGYTAIDIIMCDNADECVKLGKWFAQCDPLNNINSLPYLGLFDYEHLL